MAERDAFGNEIGEDSLAGMGWSLSGDASPSPAPAPAPAPPPAPAPVAVGAPPTPPRPAMPASTPLPQIPGARRGGSVAGRLVGWIVALAVIGGIGAAIAGSVAGISDKVKSVTDSFTVPSFTSTSSATTPEAPAKPSAPPTGLKPGSMLRADAFARALVKLRTQGSRAQTLRVDAERVSGNVLSSTGRMTVVSLSWDGTSNIVKTPARIPSASAVSLRGVSSKAPSRAVARAAAALGRPARAVNYVVLTSFAGQAQWFVYFKDGRYFKASLDGRRVERIG